MAVVLDRRLRRSDRLEAFLQGYRTVRALDHPWPLVVPAAGCSARGVALLRPSPQDERRVTWFEEDDYVASWRTVQVGPQALRARVFLPAGSGSAGDEPWDYDHWCRTAKPRYLKQCEEWMQEFLRETAPV